MLVALAEAANSRKTSEYIVVIGVRTKNIHSREVSLYANNSRRKAQTSGL
jgi:hypothetical protein